MIEFVIKSVVLIVASIFIFEMLDIENCLTIRAKEMLGKLLSIGETKSKEETGELK